MLGGFIGAIHVNGQLVDTVQIHHANAVGLEAPCAFLGACNCAVDLVLDVSEGIDEIVRRAAGANTDNRTGLHEFQRCPRHGLLLVVLGHGTLLVGIDA